MNPQSPKKTNEYLGNKVKQLRQSRNLSLNELSRKSGISKAALSKLESGDSNPRIDTLEAIAIALGFPLGDLFSFTREEYPRLERDISLSLATMHKNLNSVLASAILLKFGILR